MAARMLRPVYSTSSTRRMVLALISKVWRGVHHRLLVLTAARCSSPGVEIVSIEGDVDSPGRRTHPIKRLYELGESRGELDSAALDAHQCESGKLRRLLGYLVGHACQRAADLLAVHEDLGLAAAVVTLESHASPSSQVSPQVMCPLAYRTGASRRRQARGLKPPRPEARRRLGQAATTPSDRSRGRRARG